jgi:hypothetical protein
MRAQHGVGHGVERNRQVQIGAVLAPSIQASPRPAVQRRAGQPSPLPSTHTSPQRPSTLTAATTAEPSIQCSPSICGISPPSTGVRITRRCAGWHGGDAWTNSAGGNVQPQANDIAKLINNPGSDYLAEADQQLAVTLREFLFPKAATGQVMSAKSVSKQLGKHVGEPVKRGEQTLLLRKTADTHAKILSYSVEVR